MGRTPKHTPESLAIEAARGIYKNVDGLSFAQATEIEKGLRHWFGVALATRKRTPKEKPPEVKVAIN